MIKELKYIMEELIRLSVYFDYLYISEVQFYIGKAFIPQPLQQQGRMGYLMGQMVPINWNVIGSSIDPSVIV